MANTVYGVGSFMIFHQNYDGGSNCGMCARTSNIRFGVQYDYDSGKLLDWRDDRDVEDHLEVPVCDRCTYQFEDSVLLEL